MFQRSVSLLFVGSALFVIFCAVPKSQIAKAEDPAKLAQNVDAALPPFGSYEVDPIHSFVYFSAWHHIVGIVRGRFDKVTGTITASADPAACAVDITIATYSVSTQNTLRDDDLRGPAFFDVNRFPAMTYSGRGIRRLSGGTWIMDGSLIIRGITKMVPLSFVFKGMFPDMPPGRPARAAFHGTAATRRGDFGMTRDNAVELGVPAAPGSDVEIQIDIEANATSSKK